MTSRSSSRYKVMRKERKNLAPVLLGVIVNDAALIPTLDSWTRGFYQRNNTIHWMLTQSIYSLLENLAPALPGIANYLAL